MKALHLMKANWNTEAIRVLKILVKIDVESGESMKAEYYHLLGTIHQSSGEI